MSNSKISALITENEGWRDKLGSIEYENILFKTKLVEMLGKGFYKEKLEDIEHYQYRFLKIDEQVVLLRHEVREQLYLLQQAVNKCGNQVEIILGLQKKLEVKLGIILENFVQLSAEFNDYVLRWTMEEDFQ